MPIIMISLIGGSLWSVSAYAPCSTLDRWGVSGCSVSLVSLGVIEGIIARPRGPVIADFTDNTGGVGVSPEPLG